MTQPDGERRGYEAVCETPGAGWRLKSLEARGAENQATPSGGPATRPGGSE